jgi:hypothetical protein
MIQDLKDFDSPLKEKLNKWKRTLANEVGFAIRLGR